MVASLEMEIFFLVFDTLIWFVFLLVPL